MIPAITLPDGVGAQVVANKMRETNIATLFFVLSKDIPSCQDDKKTANAAGVNAISCCQSNKCLILHTHNTGYLLYHKDWHFPLIPYILFEKYVDYTPKITQIYENIENMENLSTDQSAICLTAEELNSAKRRLEIVPLYLKSVLVWQSAHQAIHAHGR